MDLYRIKGSMKVGRSTTRFTRELEAGSRKHAEDLVLSQVTSEHSISRSNVSIDEVEVA